MGAFFTIGEQKIRPGVFLRYENTGKPRQAGVTAGICAAIFKSNWGPLGEVVDIENTIDRRKYFGTPDGSVNTSDVIDEELGGGVQRVKGIRLGTGGAKGTFTITDTAGTPENVATVAAKYVGSRALTFTNRDSLTDATKREFIIYEGTKELKKIEYTKGSTEVDALVAAAVGNDWVTITKISAGSGVIKSYTQQALAGGVDPTITSEDYSNAMDVLEPQDWDVLAVDTEDTAIHLLVQGYIDRVFADGKLVRGSIAEKSSVLFATRKQNCAAYNDFLMHYCINGWKDMTGVVYEGYKAAARIAGLIASSPSTASLTHRVITGAVALTETLTNPQIEQALKSGAIVFTTNAMGQVHTEYGVNTLITLQGEQDEGWKKIRRVSTRMELMKRITATIDPLIGIVDNDPDGRATILSATQGVINTMNKEGKLLPGGTVIEDPNNPPQGDSAWFKIGVDDVDSGEKLYFSFGFRFAPETEEA